MEEFYTHNFSSPRISFMKGNTANYGSKLDLHVQAYNRHKTGGFQTHSSDLFSILYLCIPGLVWAI